MSETTAVPKVRVLPSRDGEKFNMILAYPAAWTADKAREVAQGVILNHRA